MFYPNPKATIMTHHEFEQYTQHGPEALSHLYDVDDVAGDILAIITGDDLVDYEDDDLVDLDEPESWGAFTSGMVIA